MGDGVRLAQVISNLLNNSARYTPPGGRIEVRAAARASTSLDQPIGEQEDAVFGDLVAG